MQIGSAIGSSLGQRLHLSDERIRNLVACGAAAGIAATFNAPIAGVMFALEVILGEFSVRYFSSVVVSAVVASVIGRAVFGDVAAFAIPQEYGIRSLWEFGLYPLLGIISAFVGVAFVRVLYWSEDVFDSWKQTPEWLRPAIGGLLLGLVALAYPGITGVNWERVPQIYNVGYDIIEMALASHLTLYVVLILLVLKLIATSLTLGSGGSGGVFAPSLFMGAMVGTAFEQVANIFVPGVVGPPGAYALVGMAAVFAASAHAPITAVLILFELTGDYQIILPLMLAVVVATVLAQHLLNGESIYTLKLSRRGVRLQHGRDVDILQGVAVEEVMSHDVYTISYDENLKKLSEELNQTRSHSLIVVKERKKLWGIVSVGDLEFAMDNKRSLSKSYVRDIAVPIEKLQVAYPDDSIGEALNKLGAHGMSKLPIVSRDDPLKLLGLIRKDDIIRAYTLALTKKAEIQHQTQRMQLRNIDGTEFAEIRLNKGDHAVGKSVFELADSIPEESLLISVRRGDKLIIPNGRTQFQESDQLTAFVRSKDVEKLFLCFKGKRDN